MLKTGDRLRHYVIKDVIKETKMSTVYLAEDEILGRDVVLKELKRDLTNDQAFVDRFQREARITAALPNHPNLVTIYEYFVEGEANDLLPYIAMEYCPLGDLGALESQLSTSQVLTVMGDVLAALTVAEEHAVVHRDLKPENLLRTHQGSVRVTDFGIAKIYGPSEMAGLTEPGEVKGTLYYIAPELAVGGKATPPSDLYSLGVIGYLLLTGRLPFDDEPPGTAVLIAKTARDPIPVEQQVPEISIRLARWVDKLLERRPERRFATAQEAIEALESAQASAGVVRSPLPTTQGATGPELPGDSPQVISSQFVSLTKLGPIEERPRLILNAVTRWPTLTVVGLLLVGSYFVKWLGLVALAAWIALSLLTFFDFSEAVAVRNGERLRWWRRHG